MEKRIATLIVALCLVPLQVCAKKLTVGVEESDYLPIYKGAGKDYVGYARELLDDFAAKYGHSLTYSVMPVLRLHYEFARNKTVDIKFPDNPYWAEGIKQGEKIAYSRGVITVTEGLLVLPSARGRAGVGTIVTMRGFTPYPYLKQIEQKSLAVIEANSPEAAIGMVAVGRGDAVYLGVITANHLMEEVMKRPGMLVFDDKLPSTKSVFSLSSILHPDVIKQFDEYLVKDKSAIARLKAKYKIVD